MKYEILIEGGFTGIPKKFKGEIDLREKEKHSLWHALETEKNPPNPDLRDGQSYHLKVVDHDQVRQASFDESNLPLPIRRFIDTVSKKR